MTEPKMVYVLSSGAYSDFGVVGVFGTPEAAMAAAPPWENFEPEAESGHDWEEHPGRGLREWTMHPAGGCDWEVREMPFGKVVP